MSTSLIVILLLLVLLLVYIITIYNTLVTLKNRFQNGFAQIEVQLKRRHDLIPNLIEVAKKAMTHERETLEAVVTARNEAAAILKAAAANPADASSIQHLSEAEGLLNGALSKLNVVMEAYPDLKTNQTMMQLNEELSTTENRVAFARQAFNDAVMAYNSYRQSFPPVLFAATFGHAQDAQMLEFADSEQIQQAPKVAF